MLRPATEADVDVIRRWRNHPEVRRSSLATHEIGPVEHRAWWTVVSAEQTRRVLIYERAGVPAGVVIFAGVGSETVEWSKYVDVDGLGSERAQAWEELQREAVAYAFHELGAARIGAATLAENAPVLGLYARTGFVETRRWVTEIDGEPREVVWSELSVGNWREWEPRGW